MAKATSKDLDSITNAIKAYQHNGIDIETIIEDTTGEYVGDHSNYQELLRRILSDTREYLKIDAKMSSKVLGKIITFNEKTRMELYGCWPTILSLTFQYIKSTLEHPINHYSNFYNFLAELKKQI